MPDGGAGDVPTGDTDPPERDEARHHEDHQDDEDDDRDQDEPT